jgi:hypothetical protein
VNVGGRVAPVALVSIAAGVHQGLFVCGAPQWEGQVAAGLVAVAATTSIALLLKHVHAQVISWRALLIATVIVVSAWCLFVFAQAAAAPFYPAAPASIEDWAIGFLDTLRNGPC